MAHAIDARLSEIDEEIGKWSDYLEFAASEEADYLKAQAAIFGLKAEKAKLRKKRP